MTIDKAEWLMYPTFSWSSGKKTESDESSAKLIIINDKDFLYCYYLYYILLANYDTVESMNMLAKFAANYFFDASCTALFLKILMAFDKAHKIKLTHKIGYYGELAFISWYKV